MRYVICYDTPCQKRRNLLAKRLETLGFRVQFSVFECDITPALRRETEKIIAGVINPAEDNVRIYPVCESCARGVHVIGIPDPYGLARPQFLF